MISSQINDSIQFILILSEIFQVPLILSFIQSHSLNSWTFVSINHSIIQSHWSDWIQCDQHKFKLSFLCFQLLDSPSRSKSQTEHLVHSHRPSFQVSSSSASLSLANESPHNSSSNLTHFGHPTIEYNQPIHPKFEEKELLLKLQSRHRKVIIFCSVTADSIQES